MIASDIHKGVAEKVAETKFQEWLHRDANSTFGEYRLLSDFTTELIS